MKNRKWLLGCAVVLCGVTISFGQVQERAPSERSDEELPKYSASSQEAGDLLRQRVTSVDWKDATFEEVLDWLQDQGEGRVNVVPKWGALQILSVDRESNVNLRLNNTIIADVLNEVISQLSDTGDVQYRAIGNKLTISTRSDFERTMYVRVYDVSDLLFRVKSFGEDAPLIDLQNAGRSGGQGSGQPVFSGTGTGQNQESQDQLDQESEDFLTRLRNLIEQTIEPDSWDLTGSNTPGTANRNGQGRIRVFNTSLVVRNTIEVHEMIAGTFRFDR